MSMVNPTMQGAYREQGVALRRQEFIYTMNASLTQIMLWAAVDVNKPNTGHCS